MTGLFTNKSRQMLLLEPKKIIPNPNQPRVRFDSDALDELAESIRRNGIIQPLAVRRLAGGNYQLISGERRLRAAKRVGLDLIPCYCLVADDYKSTVMSLIENLQREDLSFFEEAEGIRSLMELYGLSQSEVASRLSKSQSAVANKLRLLRLSKSQRDSIENLRLTERHARALLRLPDDSMRDEVLTEIIVKGLNVADTEKYIERLLSPPPPPAKRNFAVGDIRLFVNSITHAVELMRSSGVQAQTQRVDTDEYIEYRVIIPK